MKVSAIIVAAGSSSRMGFDKLFANINGECVLKHSLDLFIDNDDFSEVIVVTSEKNLNKVKELVKNTKVKDVIFASNRFATNMLVIWDTNTPIASPTANEINPIINVSKSKIKDIFLLDIPSVR